MTQKSMKNFPGGNELTKTEKDSQPCQMRCVKGIDRMGPNI